jgi:hypothetical protein
MVCGFEFIFSTLTSILYLYSMFYLGSGVEFAYVSPHQLTNAYNLHTYNNSSTDLAWTLNQDEEDRVVFLYSAPDKLHRPWVKHLLSCLVCMYVHCISN